MTTYRAQAVIPMFTNIPEDIIVNQFHFDAPAATDPAADASVIAARLGQFYLDVYGAAGFRASYIDWEAMVFKIYDLQDSTPRIPYEQPGPFTDAGIDNTAVPTEVACVLTWKAAPEAGVPYQSLYNRIYLGGIGSTWLAVSSSSSYPRISSGRQATIVTAAVALLNENDGVIDWVQRGKRGGFQLNSPIVGGWVDDSPDTQRRRSVAPTARSTF